MLLLDALLLGIRIKLHSVITWRLTFLVGFKNYNPLMDLVNKVLEQLKVWNLTKTFAFMVTSKVQLDSFSKKSFYLLVPVIIIVLIRENLLSWK